MIQVWLSKAVEDQAAMLPEAAHLWYQWARERGYDNPDVEAYVGSLMDRVRGGQYLIILAFKDGRTVGMVEVQVDYEPANRRVFSFIDKLYVVPEARGSGRVAWQLACGAELAAKLMGAEEHRLAVKDTGPRRFYERRGFEAEQTMMRYV